MIFFWCLAWSPRLNAQFKNVLKSFFDLAVQFYKGRIQKTLARAERLPAYNKVAMHQTVAFFYLNIRVTALPELWEISGLFIEEESDMDGGTYIYRCVCPPVYKAIVKYFRDYAEPTIDVLVGHLIIFLYYVPFLVDLIRSRISQPTGVLSNYWYFATSAELRHLRSAWQTRT
jgi:hypothetical protein